MRKNALAACIALAASFPGLLAQSVVFVSPSTKGPLTMSCAEGSLSSFEQMHYVAVARYVAEHLCQQSRIESAVGVWKGQAENSGMIDGCSSERAREVGALLGKYYHQEKALVFDRDSAGKAALITFHASQPLGVVAIMMAQANVSGATVIPHTQDNLILIVTSNEEEHSRTMSLYSMLHGHDFHEELGTTQMIGDEDRARARDIFTSIVTHAPADVRQLSNDMYSEQFNELGLGPATEVTASR
ncbi:MAG TPA: hypothetical protein VMB49_01455 [Acidobacteriaceae bacterium]|nr:hypothetical protein [Acidobacteriaceae bacterium]